MNWTDLTIFPAVPELVLTVVLFTVLLVDLWLNDKQRWITCTLSIIGLILTATAQFLVWKEQPQYAFHDMFVLDGMAQLAKICMYILVIALFIYSQSYLRAKNIYQGEFYTLTLFALLGMNIMVSACHFLTLYVGLELLSLALYALIALQRDSGRAAEAALKYFVLGALASGLLLYGISLIYGATGTLQLQQVLAASQSSANPWLLKLGVVFIVAGIVFKLGGVPFHMWVPDVYQGAPTAVTALVGTAPKIAATVFAFRILVYGLLTQWESWRELLLILGIASLLVGNLAAIMQTNIKRMLGFSTVAHMGFILLALLAGQTGCTAAIYYAITYALMASVAFAILMLLSGRDVECQNISDLAGLNQKNAWYAFLMLLAMFSMAGIPPLMGFYAKLAVIKALLASGYLWVSVYAVVMSLIGAFYYLRVVKTMYFDTHNSVAESTFNMTFLGKVVLSVNGLLLLLWGVVPDSVMAWCVQALLHS
ncbi:MAG: NADH-quinone oxidoreductase subunit NuoN [Snodgrassella sp.]|uniref:NADH-quinone oxidoreductase subunit NuoN n=1 Tax=Snodgrassella sp. TaxID=2815304 RepID=UPI002590F2B9|nr:NADH-quinone oxidoreductase subunit NuoN [Snodgrassella sp.]MCO6515017.1 NADH-quinone oxidoreductase subunit NuoN [Snodgrassella sp.]MCO6519412.1 NADH-quinone oxidoreductase subunit NuoN [Snodgrassella sp.]MCO6521565.1 NADH-quinone oxidoreductase subunit NuoN [Snodgrassella sp.]